MQAYLCVELSYPSTAVHPKRNETEEYGDAHERGGGRCGEELAVLELEVPQHRQHEHEQRHHQAAHVQRHVHLVCGAGARGHGPGGMLRDVAVQDAVVGQVQRGQGLSVVLKELPLVDQTHLVFLASKVGPAHMTTHTAGQESHSTKTQSYAINYVINKYRLFPYGFNCYVVSKLSVSNQGCSKWRISKRKQKAIPLNYYFKDCC